MTPVCELCGHFMRIWGLTIECTNSKCKNFAVVSPRDVVVSQKPWENLNNHTDIHEHSPE